MAANDYIETMFDALHELSSLTETYREELMDAVSKSSEFKKLYAMVLLEEKAGEGKVTVDELKAKVTKRVAASEFTSDVADAMVRATKEAMNLRTETIDACQSALAYSRIELEHTPNANPTDPIWNTRSGVT